MQVIGLSDKAAWRAALSTVEYDVYHTADYTENVLQEGEQGYLLCSGEGESRILLPVLLRPVDPPGAGRPDWRDVTSVYGYAGPVANFERLTDRDHARFHADLTDFFTDQRVVAVFSRLHPLLNNHHVLAGLGEVHDVGRTVSIDLSTSPERQRSLYRENHRTGINRLRRAGVECREISPGGFTDDFMEIYHDTMRRVGAGPGYFFDRRYFDRLFGAGDYEAHLFGCFLEGRMICAGIFTRSRGIVQYHLGGTRCEFLRLAPTKLLFDTVRLWAGERRAGVFHLGGGLGGEEDSLFHFKAGFSKRFHVFRLWKWVVDGPRYRALCERRGVPSGGAGFFPGYRRPVRPSVSL
ncbi:GNAT family N-acetyltransferase [Deinococcus aestuarii]|uniref:GNAT family N-acetyltransferase n=1 Tax=Deinococcus aestuarii TaxID=2774531 RepID=UPI001C0C3DC7|nr:GNAT family N-acetyltransferase [Deinococcus aestuarii]